MKEWIEDGLIGDVREVYAWSDRPSHPVYHPFDWRGWVDFGCGALGDMGCHILDPAFWALDLGNPVSVESSNTNIDEEVIRETYPAASVIHYEFPERNGKPPVRLHWCDGALLPPIPEGMETLHSNGAILVGEKGKLIHGSHGAHGLRVLLGVLATRQKNKKLFYDGENMRITNDEEADRLINPPYREGWSL